MYDMPYINENCFGKTYGEHREFLELDKSEYIELQGHAKDLGITLFATPFDFDSVEILIDKIPIKDINLKSLRSQIGYVPQDTFLFSDTIMNNIKFGSKKTTDEGEERCLNYTKIF